MENSERFTNLIKDRISDVLRKMSDGDVNQQEIISLLTTIQNDDIFSNKPEVASEENYKGIFDAVSDAIYILDKSGTFVEVNDGALKMYGYTKEQLVGKTPAFVSAPNKNDLDKIMQYLGEAFEGKNQEFEFWGLRKNGEIFPKIVRLFRAIFSDKEIVIAIGQDITEKINSENKIKESEEKLKNLIQFAPDPFFQGDEHGNFIECNNAACELTEFSRNELLNMNMRDLFDNKVLEKRPLRYDLLISGKTIQTEREIITKSGKVKTIEMNSKRMEDGSYQSFIRDITERKISERSLRESEERYRQIVINLKQAYYEADKRGVIIHTNPEFRIISGFSEKELVGKISFSIADSQDRERIVSEFKKSLADKIAYKTSELRVNFKHNKYNWVELLTHFQYDSNGKFIKASNIVRDITERKDSEEALKESEARYKIIAEKATDVVWLIDLHGKSLFVTKSIEQFTGFSPNEYLQQTIADRFTKESADFAQRLFNEELLKYSNKTIDSDYSKRIELDYKCKNGSVKTGELLITPYFDKHNSLVGLHGVTRDITDRKIAEKALKESEKNFRLIFENSPLGTYIAKPDGTIIDVNNALLKILGSPSLEATKQINVLTFPPLVDNGYAKIFKQCADNNQILTLDIPYKSKWGKETILSSYIIPLANENGVVEKVYTIMEDITERKIAENKLKESEERLRTLINAMPDIVCFKDGEGRWLEANDFDLNLFCLASVDYRGKKDSELAEYSEFYREAFLGCEDSDEIAWRKGVASRGEEAIPMPDGSSKIFDIIKVPTFIEGIGERKGLVVVGRDITERKIAENKLKESEEKYHDLFTLQRLMSDTMSDMVWAKDLEGRYIFANQAICDNLLIAKDTSEPIGKNDVFFALRQRNMHPEDPNYHTFGELCLNSDEITLKEMKQMQFDEYGNVKGKFLFLDVHKAPLFNNEGKLIGVVGSARDVTESKKAEKLLRESEERYKIISNTTSDYLYSVDIDENGKSYPIWTGGSFKEMTGYTFEEYKNIGGWRAILHPDDLEKDAEAFKKIANNEKVMIEVRTIHKSGRIVWVESFGSPVWDTQKNRLIGINGAVKNITKEKEALLELKEREEKYKLISSITSDYLFESRKDASNVINITWVAGSFKKITGYTLEEYKAVGGWNALLHKDDFEIDEKGLNRIKLNKKAIVEVRTYNKNGDIVWVKNTCSPIWDYKKNELIGIIGSVKDITQEKQNQLIQEIHFNTANAIVNVASVESLFAILRMELNKILDTTNFYIAFYDENSGYLTSQIEKDEKDNIETWLAEKSISGYLINSKKKQILTKNDIYDLIKKGEVVQVGTLPEIWVGVPLKIRNKVIGVMVVQNYNDVKAFNKIGIDVFEVIGNQLSLYLERNKAKEDTLKLSRAIIQSPISIIITNIDGEIEYVNPMFEKVTQYTFEEIFGKNPRILKSGNHQSEFYKNLWDTILSGKDWRGEILNKKKNGDLYWENAIITPIQNENGLITHFVAIKEDISEKKKMIEELIKSKEQAEVSEKIKTEFLAQMSHEIRSPLNVIMSFIGFIKDEMGEKISEDLDTSFQSIGSASARIIRTVDLILNMTDLQLGSYNLSITNVNLVELLMRVKKEYLQPANKKGLELKLQMKFEECNLSTDEYALVQIISNLVDNAIKYTDKGNIAIIAEKSADYKLIVKVQDTGIGMSEQFLPKLFNSFTQEEQGYTRSYDGNGLGMALVKNYCDVISAEISVESEKGKGTTFTIAVPNISEKLIEG